jgi:DNA processing protein
MTSLDAAVLAILGVRDRRLIAALLRADSGHSTAEDLEALPPRHSGESLPAWACRCRAPRAHPTMLESEVARVIETAEDQLQNAAGKGINCVPFGDAAYPPLLAAIADPPPLLWTRGAPLFTLQPTIAIVGSRTATPYAVSMARHLASGLQRAGLVVVSGLARGVDSAAHRAVVESGGRTIGVLGCGIDRVYPAEHRALALDMQRTGAIVSEFPPGVPPLKHHFPMRNRIISGLSLAVVVVEAPEKSGALITASAAAEQGRDVMVVPGQATAGRNRGGHLLIRDGAKVVESADDILQELGGLPLPAGSPAGAAGLPQALDFTVDDVVQETGALPHEVLGRLLELELTGRIQRIGGGRFVRVLT